MNGDVQERPGTAGSRSSARLLTTELVMAQTGDYDLLSMKELILREEKLEGLNEECATSLSSLEILSLSHNCLSSLESFQFLVNLVELNLNFNRIESIENLQCTGLEKLFIASNKISDIAPLRRLLRLNTVSLYGNVISDLDAALHTCRSLPQLRALDIGGNPCSRELEGYKFRVVHVLPRLKTLDGDQITPLDKELAEEFAVRGSSINNKPAGGKKRGNRNKSDTARPLTAPVRGFTTREPIKQETSPGFNPFGNDGMPRGNVRLFRDDFLNNNSILLEYLAEGMQEDSALETDGAILTARTKFNDEEDEYSSDEDHAGGKQRYDVGGRGFVDRMRTANPLGTEERTDMEDDLSHMKMAGQASRPSTAKGLNGTLTTSLGVDPSDPKATVRKLLKHIEVLMETIASYKHRELDSCRDALVDEIKQLRIENNNIPVLQSEIEDLKKRLASFQSTGGSNSALESTTRRVQSLEKENASLKREIARLQQSHQQLLHQLNDSNSKQETNIQVAATSNDSVGTDKRLGNSTLLDESAAVDVELTELILQNEVSLQLIKNEIKTTKREWEDHFQRAKQVERERVRPSTSLGLAPARSQLTGPGIHGGTGVPTPNEHPKSKARQLHTSAGPRSGPGEYLVRSSVPAQVFPVSSTDAPQPSSSSANILTL